MSDVNGSTDMFFSRGKMNGGRHTEHSLCPRCCCCCQMGFQFGGDVDGVTAGPGVHISAGRKGGERLTNSVRGLLTGYSLRFHHNPQKKYCIISHVGQI